MEEQHHLTDLTIDSIATRELREIAKWGKFLSIVGFITCGLIVLIGLFLGTFLGNLSRLGQTTTTMPGSMTGFIGALYAVFALIYFFPVLYLFQSSTKMKQALNAADQQLFNEALIKMKACFRYIGILTIILLAFYALVIIIGIAAVAMR